MLIPRQFFFLAALAYLAALPGCKEKPTAKAPVPQNVVVIQPIEKQVQRYAEFTGRILPVQSVDVRARANGYLESVHFEEGAEIKKDAPLFTIDPSEYKVLRDAAAAVYDQVSARLAQARADFERGEQLAKTAAIPKQEVERLNTEVRHAEAAVRLAKAELDKADLNLSYTNVLAPISGKVSRTLITEGNLVQTGDSLTTIVEQDPLYIYFEAPERILQTWKQNEKLEVTIGLSEEKDYPHKAELDFTDNRLNSNTGTLQLRARLANGARLFRPGYFARVRVTFGQPHNSLLIPERAVGIDQGDRFVYVVGADGKLQFRKVKAGQAYEGYRAIEEGLQPDDQVVSEGITMLKPGMQVAVAKPQNVTPEKASAVAELPVKPQG